MITQCPRCEMLFIDGVAYPSHSKTPQTNQWVAQKICQFAYKQDKSRGKTGDYPENCANPDFNCFVDYGPRDEQFDQMQDELSEFLDNEPI